MLHAGVNRERLDRCFNRCPLSTYHHFLGKQVLPRRALWEVDFPRGLVLDRDWRHQVLWPEHVLVVDAVRAVVFRELVPAITTNHRNFRMSA